MNVESSFDPWSQSHPCVVCDPFNVPLDYVCQILLTIFVFSSSSAEMLACNFLLVVLIWLCYLGNDDFIE